MRQSPPPNWMLLTANWLHTPPPNWPGVISPTQQPCAALWLAIRRYILRQQRHRIDAVQKTLERLTQRRQHPPTMADDVKTALQGNAVNGHCTHTASPELIGQGNARHNGYPDASLNALFNRLSAAHFCHNAQGRRLKAMLFQRLLHHQTRSRTALALDERLRRQGCERHCTLLGPWMIVGHGQHQLILHKTLI